MELDLPIDTSVEYTVTVFGGSGFYWRGAFRQYVEGSSSSSTLGGEERVLNWRGALFIWKIPVL